MSHIKLHGVKPRIQYVADGTLITYEFPFVIFTNTDIQVYLNDILQTPETYTVSGVKNTNGGSITFMTPPTNGTIITITRDLSIERTTDFQEGGALRADTLNDEFDYQTACLQQVADSINRSMILPPYATDTNVDLTLPTPSAGKAIVWNSDGTNLENSVVKINELESTLRAYKESAENASTEATTQAEIASDKADIATAKADIASEKANEAVSTLASKANKDMDNLSETGKTRITSFGMPDFNRGVTKSVDTPYQAETDGWIVASGQGNTQKAPLHIYFSDTELTDYTKGIDVAGCYLDSSSSLSCRTIVPCPKGIYYYQTAKANALMIFYPCKGV